MSIFVEHGCGVADDGDGSGDGDRCLPRLLKAAAASQPPPNHRGEIDPPSLLDAFGEKTTFLWTMKCGDWPLREPMKLSRRNRDDVMGTDRLGQVHHRREGCYRHRSRRRRDHHRPDRVRNLQGIYQGKLR